jgi:hypothetical protein
MTQSNTASQQLYNLLVSRDFEPEALDATGKPAADPADADIISFDYRTQEKDYGTVVLSIDGENNLDVYYGDNMGRAMEGPDKNEWYDFLYLLRMFAKRNLLTFSLKNLSRLKYSMRTMAAVKESLFEGYYGNRKVSYSDQPNQARLVIKHNKTLGEGDARFRYIESLFVENDQGERFRIPSKSLIEGRILARHVAEGGTPYDAFGQYISEMVRDLKTLAGFVRAARHKDYSGDAGHMVESAVRHYTDLKAKAKRMISRRGYHEALDTFDPSTITPVDEAVETIRELFVQQTLDPRVEQALPMLARLQEKEMAMKEADQFESWSNRVMEGTWALADTPELTKKLNDLMSQELIVGPDATNATEQLYDLVGDDQLFDILDDIARTNPDANAWDDTRVQNRLAQLGVSMPAVDATANRDDSYDTQEPDPDAEDQRPMGETTELQRIRSLAAVQ